ncbi:hypothetical protein EDM00_04275 [Ornithobacterium rhinotracheale]|nr:hypothetical protein [Ornithobacterium rhinotracheale]
MIVKAISAFVLKLNFMFCHLVFANLNGILISNVKLKLSFRDKSHLSTTSMQTKQKQNIPYLLYFNILNEK